MKTARDDDHPCNSIYLVSTPQTALSLVVMVRACCPAAQATSFLATAHGWFVTATTLSHVLPRAFMLRGDVLANSGMGIITLLFFTNPTVNPVYPAIAPCAAACARSMHK